MYGAGGRAPADRVRAAVAGGLRGSPPGAHRQRRARAVPARRLRRGHGRAAPERARRASTTTPTRGRSSGRSLDFLEGHWQRARRGHLGGPRPRRHFVHSKVMAWVAVDRAVQGGREVRPATGPVDRWRASARRDPRTRCATRASTPIATPSRSPTARKSLDASAADDAARGLPAADRPARGRHGRGGASASCLTDGFVRATRPTQDVDGLPPAKARSSPCTFWLADNLSLLGRIDEARALFERLIASPTTSACSPRSTTRRAGRMLGNFPQAFTHVSLVNSAGNLSSASRPALHRSSGADGIGAAVGIGGRWDRGRRDRRQVVADRRVTRRRLSPIG